MAYKPAPLITFLETIEDVRRSTSCKHNFIDIPAGISSELTLLVYMYLVYI